MEVGSNTFCDDKEGCIGRQRKGVITQSDTRKHLERDCGILGYPPLVFSSQLRVLRGHMGKSVCSVGFCGKSFVILCGMFVLSALAWLYCKYCKLSRENSSIVKSSIVKPRLLVSANSSAASSDQSFVIFLARP